MQKSKSPTRAIRELMEQPGIIRTLGAHDVLTAVLVEQAGFDSVFIGGFGTSASLYGLPDLNFLGMTEMVDATRRMAHRVSIPVVADADTGHGDLHNVMRCVREFEGAGAAGIILEDQVFPKRCGHFGGKHVIPVDEMVAKFKAAVAARNDDDFIFIARTDSRETDGLDDAIDRINRYCDAGADVAFIEAPLSIEELEEICKRVQYPKFVNMLAYGKTPILSASELEEMGFKMLVAPIDSVLLTAKVMREMANAMKRDGHTKSLFDDMVNFEEIKNILGLQKYLSLEKQFKK
ncbi:MAG: isocitrate lyase/PEP mutase family protein [Gammaproteobacteria bacterium]|nr:carboxyvinyl-carboxyphosphonate phosphorylmutase [Gammaproteobacteria bacterium]NIN61758.1 carboxyvinyl-carboxyphosphonate phosphorylmutase [Gammaproteobacteria bacterium]NIO62908.1 carboxyvinyl-carboxyphosphonate phosphorylmutase [Gammaproteobacteria bacterium]NIQ08156.1 isocitrate lyase/PEP mutase family protein [Gammaproteobacteria bacterium]NIQ19472.1 carboxyvinyl-carboxyphosphonate phosphorylmutase [Gammaproteobacteria bacterium]